MNIKNTLILASGILTLCCMVSVAEAKVCLLPFSDLCDAGIRLQSDTVERILVACTSPLYNLTEPLEPENDDYYCNCDKCTDSAGDH